MDYGVIILVSVFVLILLVYLIAKNQRDKKKVLKDMNRSELKTEQHQKEEAEG